MTSRLIAMVVGALLVPVIGLHAEPARPASLAEHLFVTTTNEHTQLDRATGELISTVEVSLWNLGGRTLAAPLHAVVRTTDTNVVVEGALGGPGAPPYGASYLDLSGTLPRGVMLPDTHTGVTLRFRRARGVRFTYTVEPFGAVASNPPPVLKVAPAFEVTAGGLLTFSATASDPEGEVVTLSVGSAPAGFSISATNGAPAVGHGRFAPPVGESGARVLTLVATDVIGQRVDAVVLLTVWPTNRPPTIDVPPPVDVAEGGGVAITLTAADADGDPLTVVVEPLPANAVLLQATRTITFAPDFEQAGVYRLDCRASDGMSTSTSSVLQITVRDTPLTPDPDQLVLAVHPLESPTLLARMRVSGVVNADTNPPPHTGPVSALITGLSPSGARQGEAVAVRLSGQTTVPYVSHFVEGESVADFGPGIAVASLAVIDATQAVAGIVVSPDAAVGPRAVRVQTASETAWAIPAFQVGVGAATLTGRVVDPDTGQPIAGALVVAEGTLISATTGADGCFMLTGLPAGPVTLVILPPDHEPLRVVAEAALGATTVLGDLAAAATVADLSAPAGVSLMSVIGRGGSERGPGRERSYVESEALVRDAILLCGGSEFGLLDATGLQLNPRVGGSGLCSFGPDGLRLLAEKVERNAESFSLLELLFSVSWGIRWSGTGPPALDAWMESLQGMVNAAWADPRLPEHAILLLIFNSGRTLSPDPPVLTPDVRLNDLQAFLFMSSFLTAAWSPEYTPGAEAAGARALQVMGGAQRRLPTDDPGEPPPRPYTQYWRGFFDTKNQFCIGTDGGGSAAEGAFMVDVAAMGMMTMAAPSMVGVMIQVGTLATMEGMVADRLLGAYGNLAQAASLPRVPVPIRARAYTNDAGKLTVAVGFGPSPDQKPNSGDTFSFVYRLYRFKGPDLPRQLIDQLVVSRDTEITLVSAGGASYTRAIGTLTNSAAFRDYRWTLHDPEPLPMVVDDLGVLVPAANATWFYAMTVTRVQHGGFVPDESLYTLTAPWWSMLMAENPALAPAYQRRNLVRTSDYSDPILMRLDGQGELVYDTMELELDALTQVAYVGEPMRAGDSSRPGRLYAVPDLGAGERTILASTGFAAPGHHGLALDGLGRLYTENAASDAMFGGRVFGYVTTAGEYAATGVPEDMLDLVDPLSLLDAGGRFHAGTINYFSPLLMYARPTACGPIAIGPGAPASSNASPQALYVLDEMDTSVKKIPVQALDWPAERRCGQLFADMPFDATGQDLEVRPDGTADLLVQGVPAMRLELYLDTVSRVAIGTEFEVDVTVANPAMAPVEDVQIALFSTEGDGAVAVLRLPSNTVETLRAGGSAVFTYACRSTESGELRFVAQARGTVRPPLADPASVASAVVRSDPVVIGTTLELLDVSVTPTTVRPGERFTIRATARATGIGMVTGVVLRALERAPDAAPVGRAEHDSGPYPAVADVGPGAGGVVYSNLFNGVEMGWVRYGLEASGVDEASGERVTARHLGVDVVVTPLVVGAWIEPDHVEFRSNAVTRGVIVVSNLADKAVYNVESTFLWRFDHVGFRTVSSNEPVARLEGRSFVEFPFVFSEPVEPGAYSLEAAVRAWTENGEELPAERPLVRVSIGPSVRGRVMDVSQPLELDPSQALATEALIERSGPVSNVYVFIQEYAGDEYTAYTDANGEFEIAVPGAGPCTVQGLHGNTGLGFSRPTYAEEGGETLEVLLPVSLYQAAEDLARAHLEVKLKMAELPLPIPQDLTKLDLTHFPEALSKDINGVFAMPGVYDGVMRFLRTRIARQLDTPMYYGIVSPDAGLALNEWDALVRLNMAMALNVRRFKEAAALNLNAVQTIVAILVALDQSSKMIEDAHNKHVFTQPDDPKASGYTGTFLGNDKWKVSYSDDAFWGQRDLFWKAFSTFLDWIPAEEGGDDAKALQMAQVSLITEIMKLHGAVKQMNFQGYMSDTVQMGLNLIGTGVLIPAYKWRAESQMEWAIRRADAGGLGDSSTYLVLQELITFDAQVTEEVRAASELFMKYAKAGQDVATDASAMLVTGFVDGQLAIAGEYDDLYEEFKHTGMDPATLQQWIKRSEQALKVANTTEWLASIGKKVGRAYQIAEALKMLWEAQVLQIGRNGVGIRYSMGRDPALIQDAPASYVREFTLNLTLGGAEP